MIRDYKSNPVTTKWLAVVLIALAGYCTDAMLTFISENILDAGRQRDFFSQNFFYLADVASQSLYTVAGGYLCKNFYRYRGCAPLILLTGLGLFIGTFSVIYTWPSSPHWYILTLLITFPFFTWMGWYIKAKGSNIKNNLPYKA